MSVQIFFVTKTSLLLTFIFPPRKEGRNLAVIENFFVLIAPRLTRERSFPIHRPYQSFTSKYWAGFILGKYFIVLQVYCILINYSSSFMVRNFRLSQVGLLDA